MDFKDKKAVVCGAGISGIGALSLLNDLGAILYVYDEKKSLTELEEAVKDFNDIKTAVGDFPNEWINECDVMILSPGIPGDKDFVIEFKNLGKYIIGEVELAFQCSKGKLIAITGTNGKTTTTALVGEMLENYFKSSFVVGNIGYAYTTKVSEMKDESVTVAEISSFQMEWIDTFHPNVSCILNLTEDHLDRHKTMENYVSCKLNVNANQNDDEVIVLNYDDEETKKVLELTKKYPLK